jgi:hypothetical protein
MLMFLYAFRAILRAFISSCGFISPVPYILLAVVLIAFFENKNQEH